MSDALPEKFYTTRWTQVLAAQGAGEASAMALSELCEIYYRPVEKFILHTATEPGANRDDEAREMTQAFFAKLLERQGKGIAGAEAGRGKFRSYLLGAVKHFLSDQAKYRRAQKRAPDFAPKNETGARFEHRSPVTGSAVLEAEEAVFDRSWALAILERGIERVAVQNRDTRRFERLRPWLTSGDATGQAEAAAELGLSEAALKVAIHRLRKQFRGALRDEIRETVDSDGEVEEEVRYLARVLAG